MASLEFGDRFGVSPGPRIADRQEPFRRSGVDEPAAVRAVSSLDQLLRGRDPAIDLSGRVEGGDARFAVW